MARASKDFRERYRQALTIYITGSAADAELVDAMGLGRAALDERRGLAELLSVHQSVLPAVIAELPRATVFSQIAAIAKAEEFLTQVAAPFEMTHLGWRDAVDRLRRLNESLEHQVADRTAALRASERRFQDIAEVSGDWMWETDHEHRFTVVFGERDDALSIRGDPLIGRTRWEGADANPATDQLWAQHKADLDAHRPFRQFRYEVRSAAGAERFVSASGKPVFDHDGNFLGYRGTATDETAMVEARNRAEAAEGLLRDAIESISGGFLITDAEDRLVTFNQQFRRTFAACTETLKPGTPYEEFLREAIRRGCYPQAIGREDAWCAERLAQHRKANTNVEISLPGARWVLVSEHRMSGGGTALVSVDITEHKDAERQLRDSEEQLKRAQRLAHMGSDVRNLQTDEAEWSDETFRIFGVSRDTFLPTTPNFLAMVHPDDRATVLATREQVAQGICPEPFEYRIIRPGGAVRQIYRENELIRDAAGVPLYLAGTLHDITERKRADDRIRLLQGVSLAIAEAPNFESALSDVLRLACEATGWAFAEAWMPDAGGTRLLLASVWHSDQPGLDMLAARARQTSTERGVGVVGRVWETGQALWVSGDTLAQVANPFRVDAMQTHGIKSLYALPIRSGREILAIVAFIMFEVREQDEHLIETISAVGAQLGAALNRKRIEELLGRNAHLLEAALQAAQLGSWVSELTSSERPNGRLDWSTGVFPIFGLAEDKFDHKVSTFWSMVHPDDRPAVEEAKRRTIEHGEVYDVDHRIVRRDETVRWVHQRGAVERDAAGTPIALLGVMHDITETRIVEEQLRQAQKMEAIGNLTGGMAHDFNNLLAVIIGNLDLARNQIGADQELQEIVGEAREAAWRGADLTRRLLAFARRQPLRPARIDVNQLVGDTLRLLRRLLGEDIEVSLTLAENVWPVTADPAQLEAALANLANNARDAMPRGGHLIITTANRHLDAEYAARHADVSPGDYAMIEISDTGTGMLAEVMNRIFEPFFTTKEPGRGTGLGLSMVFGFLKQSSGHVNVYSEPGVGTTFRLYLPRGVGAVSEPEAERPPAAATAGEIILVVEDNDPMRRVVVRQLHGLGYRTLECSRAAEALDVLQHEHVDLLFTDVVMPGGLDGVELARLARERWPTLKIVVTSGFPEERLNAGGALLVNLQLLSKPYSNDQLAAALRAALDERAMPQGNEEGQ